MMDLETGNLGHTHAACDAKQKDHRVAFRESACRFCDTHEVSKARRGKDFCVFGFHSRSHLPLGRPGLSADAAADGRLAADAIGSTCLDRQALAPTAGEIRRRQVLRWPLARQDQRRRYRELLLRRPRSSATVVLRREHYRRNGDGAATNHASQPDWSFREIPGSRHYGDSRAHTERLSFALASMLSASRSRASLITVAIVFFLISRTRLDRMRRVDYRIQFTAR
jgi:hypothetical protein